jgi:hypothetical protein
MSTVMSEYLSRLMSGCATGLAQAKMVPLTL